MTGLPAWICAASIAVAGPASEPGEDGDARPDEAAEEEPPAQTDDPVEEPAEDDDPPDEPVDDADEEPAEDSGDDPEAPDEDGADDQPAPAEVTPPLETPSEPEEPPPAPPPSRPPPAADLVDLGVVGRGERIGFAVGGAVALAGAGALLGAMGYFVAESRRLEREGDAQVGANPSTTDAASLRSLVEEGQRTNRAAIGLGVGGGLLVGTAAALIVLAASKSRPRTVAPTAWRGGAGLMWTGRF